MRQDPRSVALFQAWWLARFTLDELTEFAEALWPELADRAAGSDDALRAVLTPSGVSEDQLALAGS